VVAAHLTDDSQRIEQGLVWRIFRERPGSSAGTTLVGTTLSILIRWRRP
jgi:hypothetical protein